MQIRRFFAKDMRNALAEVSRELGADAAILSSRQIGGGVELLAAIDYDPSVLNAAVARECEPEQAAETVRVTAANPAPASPAANRARGVRRDGASAAVERAVYDGQHSAPVVRRHGDDARTESGQSVSAQSAVEHAEPDHSGSSPFKTGQARHKRRAAGADARTGTARIGLSPAERQTLQDPWLREAAPAGGLQDLKEELRQLRGLMQEQLQGLAWRDLKQRQPLRAMLTKRLSLLDLSPRLRDHYAGAEGRDVEHALANAFAAITRDIVNSDDPMLDHGGVFALVGATGVGKTTTIAKLAARFALRHGPASVALISTDSYRIAGHDQLSTYARLIGCAVRTAGDAGALQSALDSFVDRRLILIDTAGMSQRDARLAEQLAALASSRYPVRQLLVLSATAQRAILQESVKQFGQRPVHGAILTKLDETTSLGAVLSVLLDSRLPLMASCDGQRVPEDLRSLRGAQLVDRALKLAEQYRECPDEWLLAQEFKAQTNLAAKPLTQ